MAKATKLAHKTVSKMEGKASSATGRFAAKAEAVKSVGHKLNVPPKEASKADKSGMRAWRHTYSNRDKRLD